MTKPEADRTSGAATARIFSSAEELAAAAGEELGVSDWLLVTQERIGAFADATDDHQWIHVDPDRAADGPFGGAIAHGFLTLSLIPRLVRDVYQVTGAHTAVNYGLNRVRFPAPLRAGTEVRATVRLLAVDSAEGRVQVVAGVSVTARDADKPCCVAETVTLYLF